MECMKKEPQIKPPNCKESNMKLVGTQAYFWVVCWLLEAVDFEHIYWAVSFPLALLQPAGKMQEPSIAFVHMEPSKISRSHQLEFRISPKSCGPSHFLNAHPASLCGMEANSLIGP